MYGNVVVDTPSDPKIPYFTYRVPENIAKDIAIGQIVLVPFGKREVRGWVVDLLKKTKIPQPREITKILSSAPVLLPNYIKLLRWTSWYYHAPMIDCLKLMLPEFSQRQPSKLDTEGVNNLKTVPQELTIVPSLTHLAKKTAELKDSKSIVIYHHQLGRREKFEAWKKIYFGEAKKIIGLRSAIFAPCQNLKEIKIINEEDQTYFEERSPYYDLLAVAQKVCQITKANLVLESKAPRVETFYEVTKATKETNGTKVTKVELRILKTQRLKYPETQIIDMANEIRAGNRTPLSDALRYSLIENSRKKKPSLLFLNRLKESGQLFCLECKYSGYQPKPQERCPNCQGIRFRFYSLNLAKIANLIKDILPNAKIQSITGQTPPPTNQYQLPANIALATSAIFYSLIVTPFSLIGIISADTILNFPDFRSGERTFSTISRLINLADKNGQVIIQTYNPEHPAIKFAAKQDYQSFYRQELKERKALNYPPFSIFAKLSIWQKKEALAEKKAQTLYNKLLTLVEEGKGVEIFPPSLSTLPQRACYNIILRSLSAGRQEKSRKNLDPFLELVPGEWKVEVEPKELV
jgi:primosomal protein N' (replication factor Y)